MKKQYFGIGIGAAILFAGFWLGRAAWRAHHDLVTLEMRNAPLSAVVRSIERQTWERIIIDKGLNFRITIKAKDTPLSRVLDLVAAKAGARWQKTYAVFASGAALTRLESALQAGERLEAAGWTNLAPDISETTFPVPASGGRFGPGGSLAGGSGSSGFGVSGGGNERMMTFLPDGTVDRWSAQRLVLETSLTPELSGAPTVEATPESATDLAKAVHGHFKIYYRLEKAPFSMGGLRHSYFRHMGKGPRNIGDAGANFAQERCQQRLRDLSYSPELQVEHARGQGGSGGQIQTAEDAK
jgi:hypothetical protein